MNMKDMKGIEQKKCNSKWQTAPIGQQCVSPSSLRKDVLLLKVQIIWRYEIAEKDGNEFEKTQETKDVMATLKRVRTNSYRIVKKKKKVGTNTI